MALALGSMHSLQRLAGGPVRRFAGRAASHVRSAFGKGDLKDAIKQEMPELTDEQITAVLNVTFKTIVAQVNGGQNVTVTGFGTFQRRFRPARKGRNPSTGAALDIPEKHTPVFSAGKNFKEAVATGDINKFSPPKEAKSTKAAKK